MKNNSNLIWIDLEMTGLNPDKDKILEIATIVTDKNLNLLGQGPAIAIHQSAETLEGMDDWNKKTHGESGLCARVQSSQYDEAQAEAETLEFISQYVNPNKSPMCGNSICQDRRFLWKWMSKLEDYFHYRNLDVSSLKELVKRWRPELYKPMQKKESRHQALADIQDSIDELKHYRTHFIKLSDDQ